MDFGDAFRRFFGFPGRSRRNGQDYSNFLDFDEDVQAPNNSHVDDEQQDDGFRYWFGNYNEQDDLNDMFQYFNDNMEREMASLHRAMEDMMKGFGAIDFPTPMHPTQPDDTERDQRHGSNIFVWSNIPSPFFENLEPSKNPRSYMLKDTDDKDDDHRPALAAPSNPQDDSQVFTVPKRKPPRPEVREDTDLDGKFSKRELMDLFKKPSPEMGNDQRSGLHGFFSSGTSVSTFSGPSGRVEFKKVVTDSSGRQENTVTRSIGDQCYTVTTVTGKDGAQEKHETFKNMDEKDLDQFEQQWRQSSSHPHNPADPMITMVPRGNTDFGMAPRDKDLFSRLFGPRSS